jgi:hypothetical protein
MKCVAGTDEAMLIVGERRRDISMMMSSNIVALCLRAVGLIDRLTAIKFSLRQFEFQDGVRSLLGYACHCQPPLFYFDII